MKAFVISDIHGNIDSLSKVIEIYRKENADYLIILGDFASYYFSSSDFEVAEILNNMSASIIAVKGNCDSERTCNLLDFDLSYIKQIKINNIPITLTHGHIYNISNLPQECGKIFLFGHTHHGIIEKINNRIIANPGSISKPRGGTEKSFIVIDETSISLKSLQNELIKRVYFS